MAKTYEQLQQQIEALQAEAEKLRRKELGEVIGRIRQAIDFYKLTPADLGFGGRTSKPGKAAAKKKPGRKAAANAAPGKVYRNDAGQEWGGRGKRPQWLRDALLDGHELEEFRVASS